MHDDDAIDVLTGESTLPEILVHYNKTKIGMDMNYEMVSLYSTARISCFFLLLDVTGVNTYVIVKDWSKETSVRHELLKDIGKILCKEQIILRAKIQQTPLETKQEIRKYLNTKDKEDEEEAGPSTTSSKVCYCCPRRSNRYSKIKCVKCQKPICKIHTVPHCGKCLVKDQQ